MKVYSSKPKETIVQWAIQFGIGCVLLFIFVQLIDIIKMLIWGV